jgi:cation diffusion facilitator CzcD-associated flavoprotein CzcO
MATAHHRVAILGAGFSGLCVGARLKQHGHDDVAIFEKAEEVCRSKVDPSEFER